ncbi:MAG: STAS domain-containing protein [Rickettsiales bacterium]|nr:STAS domain-containing protein [Rickettsiales bacterium]
MEMTLNKSDDSLQINLQGQFTFEDNQRFKAILEHSQLSHTKQIALDFSKVDFIDSAGLGMLLLLRDSCLNNHVSVILKHAKGQVQKIFAISKFDQLFDITN